MPRYPADNGRPFPVTDGIAAVTTQEGQPFMNKRVRLTALLAGMIVMLGAQPAQAGAEGPRVEHVSGIAQGGDSSAPGHMGLSLEAWREYRAGERASDADAGRHGASGHMGLSLQAWQEYRAGERAA